MTGWLSWMIFKSIGRTDEDSTYVDFVREGSTETARPAAGPLVGGGSQKCGQARSPYFNLTCLAPSPNRPTRASHGCEMSGCAPEIGSISGHSMAGRCHRAKSAIVEVYPACEVTVCRAMAATPISRTPTPLRSGSAGPNWMAVSNST
jgi:hypothetical protein